MEKGWEKECGVPYGIRVTNRMLYVRVCKGKLVCVYLGSTKEKLQRVLVNGLGRVRHSSGLKVLLLPKYGCVEVDQERFADGKSRSMVECLPELGESLQLCQDDDDQR